jgi:hypothetical protein
LTEAGFGATRSDQRRETNRTQTNAAARVHFVQLDPKQHMTKANRKVRMSTIKTKDGTEIDNKYWGHGWWRRFRGLRQP